MKTTTRLLLLAVLTLPVLAACKKEEAQTTKVEKPAVAKPADANDENAWNAYITDQVTRNLNGATSPFAYVLPAPGSADFDGAYQRQLEKARLDVARGGVEGTLLAFASPDSAKTADFIVDAFKGAGTDTMKGVRVLFIGSAADSPKVQAAVAPAGVDYKFIEAK